MDRIDIITRTLGKALGGALGGFTTGRQEIIDLLRQRSRPYLFSNTVAPPIVAAALEGARHARRDRPRCATSSRRTRKHFREAMTAAGFDIMPGVHPIVPDHARRRQARPATWPTRCSTEGIYVIGFFYPVVPKGQARIRVQVSAAHNREHLDQAIAAFTKVGKELGVIEVGLTARAAVLRGLAGVSHRNSIRNLELRDLLFPARGAWYSRATPGGDAPWRGLRLRTATGGSVGSCTRNVESHRKGEWT